VYDLIKPINIGIISYKEEGRGQKAEGEGEG
jgi:hypothetical protein